MVNLKDWFYMVNVGHFGDVFLHVRILGVRSLWTFPEPESRLTKHAPDLWESAPQMAFSYLQENPALEVLSTPPTSG